jgi:hypothetical protein
VLAVVVVVSVPRLGRIARAENDADARATVCFLAQALAALAETTALEEPPRLSRLLEQPEIRRSLADAVSAGGPQDGLFHHGYLFEVVPLPAELVGVRNEGAPGRERGAPWAVQARPRHPGRTGERAYMACPDGGVFGRGGGGPPSWHPLRPVTGLGGVAPAERTLELR